MTTSRTLLLAAPAALALLIGAPPALAISTFSDFKCDDPTTADNNLNTAVNVSNVGFTGNHDEKDCKKLCSELQKVCESNAKSREKCIKTDDKAFFSALKDRCKINNPEDKDAEKACEDDVKIDEDECKDDLKAAKDQAKTDCDNAFGKDSTCESDCDIQAFPFFD